MKKSKLFLAGISGILLVFGLVLAGCPNPAGSEEPLLTTVTGLELGDLFPAPVKNAAPATAISDHAQYTGTIAWKKPTDNTAHSGPFAASTAYTAVVTLTAKTGYTFSGVTANSFTYTGATSVANAANSGVVTIVFPQTVAENEDNPVSAFALGGLFTAPARGAAPETTIIHAQYTGTIAWKAGTEDHTGNFAASTAYTAVVTLTAAEDYTFTGATADSFTYTGAASVASTTGNETVTVTITFPATTAVTVDAFALGSLFTAPVRDAAPETTITHAQYTGTIAWKAGTEDHTGNFAASTAYTAVVTQTAAEGYTFTGVAANSFTYTGAASVTGTTGNETVTVTINFPATAGEGEDNPVNAFDLGTLVTAPVTGGMPDTTAINETQYTGSIAWKAGTEDHTGPFAASTAYTAVITLTAAEGYTFSGVAANSFTYSGAVVTNAANNGVVTIVFPETAAVVSDFALGDLFTAPVTGAKPATETSTHAQYTGTIAWKKTTDNTAHSGPFAASTAYTAVVTLTAKTGYTFSGVTATSFTYTGATSVVNEANSGTVTIVFPQTAAVVSGFALESLVTAPVTGATPATTTSTHAQYTGTIAWKKTTDNTAHSGPFAASTVYTATVTLAAASGYTFSGVTANSFTYTGATSVANAANSGVVTIVFPATAALQVNAFALGSLFTAPVKGATPATATSTHAQYTGTIAWKKTADNTAHSGPFAASTVYTATVTLTAKTGYTFSGVAADSFTHTGATSITSTTGEETVTVTITFPATVAASDGNTAPKTLVITDINVSQYPGASILVGIFPQETPPENALSGTGIVAGADSSEGVVTIKGSTATADLYVPDTTNRWTGSGTYDVYLIISSGGSESYYRKQSVSFTSASTEVPTTEFDELEAEGPAFPDDNAVAKTLVITGINVSQQEGDSIIVGIFKPGTPLENLYEGIVAGADSRAGVTFNGSTATAALYDLGTETETRWTGSGTYDVYLIVLSGSSESYYRKQNVSFSSASTVVPMTDFGRPEAEGPAFPDDNADPKTLVITDINVPQQEGDSIIVEIFAQGTSPEDALSGTGIVARADSRAGVTFKGSTATANLYVLDTDKEWTGSGTYDVYLIVLSGDSENYYENYYLKKSVAFSSASTEVSMTDFDKVEVPGKPGEDEGDKDKGDGEEPGEYEDGKDKGGGEEPGEYEEDKDKGR
jgi:hypothetical protein